MKIAFSITKDMIFHTVQRPISIDLESVYYLRSIVSLHIRAVDHSIMNRKISAMPRLPNM